MSEDELLALIEQEEARCISSSSGALAEQRQKAMDYYYGRPYGNEIAERSQVVTTEVKDAVEGILPSLMAIFTASDEIVRAEPQNPDDDAAASQATDYVNYVFGRVNNGFMALYCMFKDALLQKNGYVKVYWEDYADQAKESYEGLNELEFQSLMQDPELELLEYNLVQDVEPLITASFRRTKKYGKICIDPIPPEEVLVSRDSPNDLTKARFVEHRTLKTISEIRKMGYDVPDDIPDQSSGADWNQERIARLSFDDADAGRPAENNTDPSTREVWLCEAYLFVDYDQDGIAEYRKVTKVGKTVLDNVEFDSLPIIGGSAIPMPHKHYGLGLYDLVGDIQLIKSTITRQLLDNAYVANNGRMAVLDGMVNMGDLLTSRPNGIVRMKALGALQRIDQPVLGAPFFGLLEYFDKVAQSRVGSTGFPNAVDPDAINAKATFVDRFAEAAMERIHLMARILAEGPVKAIFWKIMELEAKHRQKPVTAKLRGRWVQVDPREWKNKFDLTVSVGIGTGSQQTVLNGAMGILNIQQGMGAAGLAGRVVSEANAYHAGRKFAKAVFPRDADLFFTDPTTLPPPQPKPDPELIKLQYQDKWKQMGDDQKHEKMGIDAQLETMRQELDKHKTLFLAHAEQALKDKELKAEAVRKIVEMAREDKKEMEEAAREQDKAALDAVFTQAINEHKAALDATLTALAEQQKAQNEAIARVHEAVLAPKEIIRDEKGKAKGVRVKKEK